jgi:hypothetical protein
MATYNRRGGRKSMNKEATKEKIESEFINILSQKFGISGDHEAEEILRGVVFGKQEPKKEDSK